MILGWVRERWYGVMGTGLVWLRIVTGGELSSIELVLYEIDNKGVI
jgi:hypothetical protein